MGTSYRKSPAGLTAEETVELDREFVVDTFAAPDADAQLRWERAKRKPGSPRNESAPKTISVTIARTLLAQSDDLARRLQTSRSSLIARGLRAVLAAEAARRRTSRDTISRGARQKSSKPRRT